jgi:hypothetical protein
MIKLCESRAFCRSFAGIFYFMLDKHVDVSYDKNKSENSKKRALIMAHPGSFCQIFYF